MPRYPIKRNTTGEKLSKSLVLNLSDFFLFLTEMGKDRFVNRFSVVEMSSDALVTGDGLCGRESLYIPSLLCKWIGWTKRRQTV